MAIIEMIGDENAFIKSNMLYELRWIDSTRYAIEIAELLENDDDSVRRKAIRALKNTKERKVIPAVMTVLEDPHWQVRYSAIVVLNQFNSRRDNKRIGPILMKMCDDENFQVRAAAITSLSKRHSKKAFSLYLKALKDKDSHVRTKGIEALKRVKKKKAVPKLIGLLKDESLPRSIIINILTDYIKERRFKPNKKTIDLITSFLSIYHILDSSFRIRNEAIQFLVTAWKKGRKKYFDRDKIINGLMQIATLDYKDPTPLHLKIPHPLDLKVRINAIEALGLMGTQQIIPNLEEGLKKEKNKQIIQSIKNTVKRLKKK